MNKDMKNLRQLAVDRNQDQVYDFIFFRYKKRPPDQKWSFNATTLVK